MSDLDDLDAMFPDLSDSDSPPELERTGTFGEGFTFRQEPPPSTDIALVAMFQLERCTYCNSTTLSTLGWAVKRKHHCRNTVIELQFVMDSALPLYTGLPKLHDMREKEVPFCRNCYMARGYENTD